MNKAKKAVFQRRDRTKGRKKGAFPPALSADRQATGRFAPFFFLKTRFLIATSPPAVGQEFLPPLPAKTQFLEVPLKRKFFGKRENLFSKKGFHVLYSENRFSLHLKKFFNVVDDFPNENFLRVLCRVAGAV